MSEEAEMEEAFRKMEDKEEEDIRKTLKRWDGEDRALGNIPRDAQGRPEISEIEREVGVWIAEVQAEMEDLEEEDLDEAWDDVRGGVLPVEKVVEARAEEVGYMKGRNIWSIRPIAESWAKTGKGPTTTQFVDTNKGGPGEMEVRSRLVARDFNGGEKGRDDLFAETPPLEAKRLLLSRAATIKKGRRKKARDENSRPCRLPSRRLLREATGR